MKKPEISVVQKAAKPTVDANNVDIAYARIRLRTYAAPAVTDVGAAAPPINTATGRARIANGAIPAVIPACAAVTWPRNGSGRTKSTAIRPLRTRSGITEKDHGVKSQYCTDPNVV